jgi:hypothetical protein
MKRVIWPLVLFVLGFVGAREISSRGVRDEVEVVKREEVDVKRGKREQKISRVTPNGVVSAGFARQLREAEEEKEKRGYWKDGREVFRDWFRVDPDAALEAMKMSPVGAESGGVLYFLCYLFEEEADEGALQAMGERLDQIIQVGRWHESGFSGDIYREFNFAVGRDLVERVRGLPESYIKEDLFRYAMAGWLFKDWKGAADWSMGLSGKEQREADVQLFSEGIPRGLARDKEGVKWAAEVAVRQGNRDLLVRLGPSLVGMMAQDGVEVALAWAGKNLSGMTLGQAVSGVVSTAYRKAPEQSEAIVDGLPLGGVRQQAARVFVLLKSRTDGLGAFERAWAEEAAGMDIGIQTWYSVGRAVGQQNPEEARRILAETDGELNTGFKTYAMEQAFWKEPEEAKLWAEEMQGEKREDVIDLVFRAWHLREQDEAKAWRDALKK